MATALEGWHDFFVAQVGACAALAGLLFVGISINIERILKYPWLPNRAAETLVALIGSLVASSLVLIPGQSVRVLGIEVLAGSITAWAIAMMLALFGPKVLPEWIFTARLNFVLVQIATLPILIGGIVLTVSEAAGVYWIAGGVVMSLAFAMFNAWVFLVEVVR